MSVESPVTTCPRCAAEVAPDARFCATCGQPLAPAGSDDEGRRARLAAAAPAPLVDKMRAARLTGERKPVTALFADVVGSTALAEQMDPEDWTQLINEVFDLMSQAVFRYEGTIAQLQGDAMLAFFGAPVAHEDDPERAVMAALDMVASIEEFARQLKASQDIDFSIRAGINSGPVVVGNVGSDLRYEYTALGDAMNVAARLQAAAQPGSVLITHNTRRLLGDGYELDDLGELEVKGKSEPVRAYRVQGRRAAPGRKRGLASVGLESPMVGRDEQLATLRSLLDIARAGRARLALLLGEPGIGKSRLLAELRRTVEDDGQGALWVEGRCISYGQNLPYHLLIDIVRSAIGLPVQASDSQLRAELDSRLAAILAADGADIAPFLAHLLGLPLRPDELDRAKIEPDVMQSRYIAATHRLLRALSAERPLVLVCEDLHWADQASVEVMRQLMPIAMQLPMLHVLALRAERDSAGWLLVNQAREFLGEALSEITLKPLSDDESRDLVGHLLAIESLPDTVRDVILGRAEGNPFFVEEVVRMLIERGVLERRGERWVATAEVSTVDIPETLHGLLLARIDQLPDDAKRALRVASVIGRQFPVRVLERVLSDG
jgi:class 3 adenylate cyclase/energy-coupling factor transporter ATP-binding protein EcfA2